MTDFDDLLLREVFADYSHQTAPRIKPAGVQAADESVRHRRRVRGVTIAVVAVLAFAVPVAAYALTVRPAEPPIGGSPSPDPKSSSNPSPSSDPTPAPTGSPAADPTETVPPGGFTAGELKNATFILPSWDDTSFTPEMRCTSGSRTFVNGYSDPAVYIGNLSYVDADRDGQYETIVRMRCERGLSEVAPEQIILLGRGTGGQIRTWGQVVTTKDGIRQIGEITGLTDGSIRVDVRDRGLCCSSPYTDTQHQWRTYSWDGQKFAQTAGATAFSTQTVELAVAMNDLVFGKPVDGVRTGTLRVTVQNMGGTAVPRVLLVTELFHAQITTPGWTVTRVGQGMEAAFAGLAVSGAATIDLTFRTTESNRSMVGVGIIAIGMTTEGDYLRDTKPLNNQGEATSGIQAVIRFS